MCDAERTSGFVHRHKELPVSRGLAEAPEAAPRRRPGIRQRLAVRIRKSLAESLLRESGEFGTFFFFFLIVYKHFYSSVDYTVDFYLYHRRCTLPRKTLIATNLLMLTFL